MHFLFNSEKESEGRYQACFLCLIIILKHICLMRQNIFGKQQTSEEKNPGCVENPASLCGGGPGFRPE